MLTKRHTRSAALAVACLAASACQQQQGQVNEAANAANAAQQDLVPEIPLPAPEKPLSREQLLLAATQAASAFAAGSDDSASQKALAGKDFEFRFRFGCAGEADDGGSFASSVDPASNALKVRAAPNLSPRDAPVKAIAGEAFETVEGFWVSRPWLLAATCPTSQPGLADADAAATAAKPAPGEPSELVGLAEFFTATGPRTMRRSGRPYEATKKLDPRDKPAGGFDLVLSGRLVALPDGRVIACTAAAQGQRPSCIISVEFGKVWIERADTHEHIADWGSG